jgi:hypothetical protein
MYRLNAKELKPVHDWVKTYERFWTHQLDQVKQRRAKDDPAHRPREPAHPTNPKGGVTTMPASPSEQIVQTLEITRQEEIAASIDIVFETFLEQMGPYNETPEKPMPMKLEAWPGDRWYRDLGNDTGHFWGHVQAVKPPTLLEICGPLFMSFPATIQRAG